MATPSIFNSEVQVTSAGFTANALDVTGTAANVTTLRGVPTFSSGITISGVGATGPKIVGGGPITVSGSGSHGVVIKALSNLLINGNFDNGGSAPPIVTGNIINATDNVTFATNSVAATVVPVSIFPASLTGTKTGAWMCLISG